MGPRRQAQPGQGERHLAPVFLLPIKLIIAVICGIALNKLRYNALFCALHNLPKSPVPASWPLTLFRRS